MAACFSIMSMRISVCVCMRAQARASLRINLHRQLQEAEHPIGLCIACQRVMKGVTFNQHLFH